MENHTNEGEAVAVTFTELDDELLDLVVGGGGELSIVDIRGGCLAGLT